MSTWPKIVIYEAPIITKGRPHTMTQEDNVVPEIPIQDTPLSPRPKRDCKNKACCKPFTPDHYLQVYCTVECRNIVRRESHRIQEKQNRLKRIMRARGA